MLTRIIATFIGANGSLGYEHGKQYDLFIKQQEWVGVLITRLDGTGMCPYRRLDTFLDNWQNISKVKE